MFVASKDHSDNVAYKKFRRQLVHTSLARILAPLKAGMEVPEVTRFPDGHFRRAIYSLGPYIADYPEQALLACIVQGWCAKYVLSVSFQKQWPHCHIFHRCTASPYNLDKGDSFLRHEEHTERLVRAFELGDLWDAYGIVGDIIVSF